MFKRTFVQICTVLLVGVALYGWLTYFHAPTTVGTALAAQQAAILHEPESGFPPVISYQGRLLDPATGQPKPDGGYLMLFALYKEASGGAPFWTESKNVTSNKGLFSTLLGDTTALTLADFNATDTLYLGVSVGGDPEATPRQRLASVSHAVFSFKSATASLADNSKLLGGLNPNVFARASDISPMKVVDWREIMTVDSNRKYFTTQHLIATPPSDGYLLVNGQVRYNCPGNIQTQAFFGIYVSTDATAPTAATPMTEGVAMGHAFPLHDTSPNGGDFNPNIIVEPIAVNKGSTYHIWLGIDGINIGNSCDARDPQLIATFHPAGL